MSDATVFDRRFIAYYALWITTVGMVYIFCITFIPIPGANDKYASLALGFVLGTFLAAPIGFFYGAAKSQPPTPPLSTTLTVPDDTKVATLEVTK